VTHRPRRRFGQHFLHDPAVIDKIVAAIAPRPGDLMVEIGPGHGAITLPLLERVGRLEVVELDRDLIGPLQAACAGRGELIVHNADALSLDFAALAGDRGRLRVVGNLPYNISTPLLFHLLSYGDCLQDMHFMLQKEVVARMAADPGTKAYGRLTVMLAAACRVEPLFEVGPGAFIPPPRVRSAVVRLTPWAEAPFPIPDRARFARIVSRAFSMRRKTLRNALKGVLDAAAIQAAGCDPGARPGTLRAEDFARLAASQDPTPAAG
jgi:16S rRNA (adenine1518-N6/adenine1519-N6)-dimethyltransferase